MIKTVTGLAGGVLICTLSLSTGCSSAPVTKQQSYSLTVEGDVADFRGQISPEAAKSLLSVLNDARQPVRSLLMASAGGDGPAAIAVARSVHERGLDVVVDGICASACAQFVLLAGKRKVVRPGSVIIFHSNAVAMEDALQASPLSFAAPLFAAQARAESGFYRQIGVDPEVLRTVGRIMDPICTAEDTRLKVDDPYRYAVGWRRSAFVPTPQQLDSIGVKGIEGSWPSPAGLASDLRRLGFVANFRPAFLPEAKALRQWPAAEPARLPKCPPAANQRPG